MNRPDITQVNNLLAIQGDRVLVYRHGDKDELKLAHVLTLVHLVGEKREMRLMNREGRSRKPDWAFTQAWYDRLREARKNEFGAKWEVTLKSQ